MTNHTPFSIAMNAALFGPPKKLLKIKNHEFNVKQVRVEPHSSGIRIVGTKGHHISHCLTLRPDDQIFYSCFVNSRGSVEDLTVNVKTSTQTLIDWAKKVGDVLKLLNAIKEAKDNAKSDAGTRTVFRPANGTEKLVTTGKWHEVANFLIANIVIAVANEHLPGAMVKPPSF